jgi:hypothetical protein
MNEFQVLNELLQYRITRYLNWPVDWRDFPIFKSNTFDPFKITRKFNWVTDVAAIYAHRPPFTAAVDVVSFTAFGRPVVTRLTCDTAGKLYQQSREKINYGGCTDVGSLVARWGGSVETQKLITDVLKKDMYDFSCAFFSALKIKSPIPVSQLPVLAYSFNIDIFKDWYFIWKGPQLNISLAFPLPRYLSGEKILRFISVEGK